MSHLETLLSWLTLSFEIALCGFVYARRAQKVLPFFTAYSTMLLVNTASVWIVYQVTGFRSLASYYSYWISVLVNAALRSLAIAELCRYKLSGYRGIWQLIWRLLVGLSVIFLVHAGFDALGQPNRLQIYGLTLDRDLDIASLAILIALLLIHNYYGLSLEPLQKTIAAGMCFFCGVDIVGDTVLRTLFAGYMFPFFSATIHTPLWLSLKLQYDRVNHIWSTIHLFSFMASMGIWCFALRKPIPERTDSPSLLPVGVYEELSPAINLRLSAFNNRLLELLKT